MSDTDTSNTSEPISPADRARHRKARQTAIAYISAIPLRHVVSIPVIYSLTLPFLLIDLWTTFYMRLCFPLYRIPRVVRRDYVVIDRHRLAYLNGLQKLNCFYCGYVNGVVAYVREVAARTEAYWCPIKHAHPPVHPHDHYSGFMEYGDEVAIVDKWADARERVARGRDPSAPFHDDD